MAAKLVPMTLAKKFLKGVKPNSYFSPFLTGNHLEFFQDNNQICPQSSGFEQFLINSSIFAKSLDDDKNFNLEVEIFKCCAIQKGFVRTVQTDYEIILKLGFDGNIEEIEKTCQNLVKEGCPGVEEVLLNLVSAFVRNGRIREALWVLPHIYLVGLRPPVEMFNVVLSLLIDKNGDFQDVLFVYKEMIKIGVVPNVDTLNYLIAALFDADQIKSAVDQFWRMSKKGCNPNAKTFELLIKGLIAKTLVDEAVLVLGIMYKVGCQPDLSFYTCVISLFCHENKINVGRWLFRMMKASNIIPDTLIYSTLIQSLCENLSLDEALFLLEEMVKSGLMPGDNVFVSIIKVFTKLEKLDEAIKFLEDKCICDTSPHNALLEGCCNAGKILLASCVLGKMSQMNLDDCNSWNILIRWLCKNARIGKALEFLGRMIVSSFVPNEDTYAALIIGNCKFSRYEVALQLIDEVHSRCWVLDSGCYSELIEGLCQAKRIMEAAELFCYMSKYRCSLHPSLFGTLIKGICDIGRINEALGLLQLASYAGTFCNNVTYASIIHELSKSNKVEISLVVFSQMLVLGCRFNLEAYCILIHSFSAINRVKDSTLLFNRMVKEGFLPDSERLYNLLLCIANHSQLHMISTSIDKLITGTELVNTRIYNLLINGLWKEDKKYEACQLLDSMLEKGWMPDAMTHGLLVGSHIKEKMGNQISIYEDSSMEDNVSSILLEGLGNM